MGNFLDNYDFFGAEDEEDPFSLVRRRNRFLGGGAEDDVDYGYSGGAGSVSGGGSDSRERLRALLTSEAPSASILREIEESRPRRENYKAGLGTKLLASIAGLSAGIKDPGRGIETATRIVERPYEDAYSRWMNEAKIGIQRARLADEPHQQKILAERMGLTQDEVNRRHSETQGRLAQQHKEGLDYRAKADAERNADRDDDRAFRKTMLDETIKNREELIRQRELDRESRNKPKPEKPVTDVDVARDAKALSQLESQAHLEVLNDIQTNPKYRIFRESLNFIPSPDDPNVKILDPENSFKESAKDPRAADVAKNNLKNQLAAMRRKKIEEMRSKTRKSRFSPVTVYAPDEEEENGF